jgi:transcriptional regulator with XRE-family HTH domain
VAGPVALEAGACGQRRPPRPHPRRRRRLLGLTQQQLGDRVGIRFQQIQKYECGANRISASRLWQLSEALEVPVGYFYDGLSDADRRELANQDSNEGGEMFARKETLDLIRAYYQLGERPRRRLLDLAKSLNGETDAA